jgi:DNA recombination protein RmuC
MTILVAIGAALAGFLACWLWAQPRLAERGRLLVDREQHELDLRGEIDRRDAELRVTREELSEARANSAASAARLAALEEKLPETVRSISQEALDASRDTFLAQAGERVERTLLPVQQRLGDLRRLVDETEARRLEDGGRLTAQLELLSAGARSIAVALGSTQSRGRWGEIQLERILEFVGMEEGVDYSCQTSKHGGRPDVVVHLPGGKNVVIDSKAPFDAFERATQGSSEEQRAAALAEFARKVRMHVQELGRKGYWAHVTPSPDFTFMFLPGDAYLAAAEEQDPQLFSFAYDRGVLLATPRTIVVMLRTIRVAWQNENASEHAETVLQVASELHERLSTMADHLAKVGRGLDSAVTAYNKAVGSYGSRVLVSARRLEGLAATRSTLDDVPPLTEHASSQLQPTQLEVIQKNLDAA